MFASVLAAPKEVTGAELDRLFGCDAEQQPIDGVNLPDLSLLEVIAYLHTLARFVQRHLRQGFVRVSENLVGKVRGRVLISNQIRENLVRARRHPIVSEFSSVCLDTLENRVLKAALDTAAHWLARQPIGVVPPPVNQWIAVSRSALAAVPDYQVNQRDWTTVRKAGLMASYAKPLAFARLVLTRLHLTPTGAADEDGELRTLPFFLDANRLFEGWVGVCLAHAGCDPKAQGTRHQRVCGTSVEFRPDFVLPNLHAVVDAKYKRRDQGQILGSDLYQVIGYARLLEPPGRQGGQDHYTDAWLAFPDIDRRDGPLTLNEAKQQFRANWDGREGIRWPDGFKLGCVTVSLPRR